MRVVSPTPRTNFEYLKSLNRQVIEKNYVRLVQMKQIEEEFDNE